MIAAFRLTGHIVQDVDVAENSPRDQRLNIKNNVVIIMATIRTGV